MGVIYKYISSLAFCFVANATTAQIHHKVSVLLPFQNRLYETGTSAAQLGTMCRHYYQGLLIAADDLANADHYIHINVYDTDNDSTKTAKIIQKSEFAESDLIFGPVMQGGNKMVSDFARQKKLYQISPLMTFSRPKIGDQYWISANPDLATYGQIIAKYLNTKYGKDTLWIIVVSDNGIQDKSITPELKKSLLEHKHVKVKIIDNKQAADINATLSDKHKNVVFVPSSNEQLANQILYRIKDTIQANNIEVLGIHQWFDFKTIDPSIWQRKNVTIVSNYFVDYKRAEVQEFIDKYRNRYSAEPTEEAFKGYDQAKYFLGLLLQNGKVLFNTDAIPARQMLHTHYAFVKNKQEGQYRLMHLNFIRFVGNELSVEH
jgi:ABC-type branched-subunit amino acid transport system substrate-binding protein